MPAKGTVLVVDDEEMLRTLLTFQLSAAGFAVVTQADGLSGLQHIEREPPDVVVLDAMMPVMDGFEVLARLKADEQLADIPIVMLTAMARPDDIVKALDAGAADYMTKPFNPDELVARLARLMRPARAAA